MLKQLVITIALFSLLGAYTIAQEKPGMEKKEHKHMEHMQKDSGRHNMHHDMKMEESKETAAAKPWNKVCPVRGGEVDPEVATVEYNGKDYGFCCGGCDSKFAKDPDKYLNNLSEDGTKFLEKK